jgi:hypothetical protein
MKQLLVYLLCKIGWHSWVPIGTSLMLDSNLKLLPIMASDESIITAIDPWMLSCAVGVSRGEWTESSLTFDTWFMCCETTWVPKVANKTGSSIPRIKSALESFVRQNRNKTSDMVLREVSEQRGEPVGITLKPGESRTIAVTAKIGETVVGLLTEDKACPQCGVICIGDGTLGNHKCGDS